MVVGDFVKPIEMRQIVSTHKNDKHKTDVGRGWHGLGEFNFIKEIDGDYAYLCAGYREQANKYVRVAKGSFLWKVRLADLILVDRRDIAPVYRERDFLEEMAFELLAGRRRNDR